MGSFNLSLRRNLATPLLLTALPIETSIRPGNDSYRIPGCLKDFVAVAPQKNSGFERRLGIVADVAPLASANGDQCFHVNVRSNELNRPIAVEHVSPTSVERIELAVVDAIDHASALVAGNCTVVIGIVG